MVITGTDDTLSIGYRLQRGPTTGIVTKFLLNRSSILQG